MKQTISRTITTTTILHAIAHMDDGGKPTVTEVEPITVSGNVKGKDVEKTLKSHYYGEHDTFIIMGTHTNKETYEMDLDQFIQNATKIEKGDK